MIRSSRTDILFYSDKTVVAFEGGHFRAKSWFHVQLDDMVSTDMRKKLYW